MPEIPDFESIALRLSHRDSGQPSTDDIVEQLRQVWNARGAADIAKIDTDLSAMMGVNMAGPYVKNLDRALRALDR